MTLRALLIAVTIALAACTSGSVSQTNQWPNTDVIEVATNSGVTTSDIVGEKITLINLWALWCAPCREELPRLQDVSITYADNLDVVGINIGDDFSKTTEYINDARLTFPMFWDESGDLLIALKVPSVPATLAVDAEGKIVWSHLGALSAEQLAKTVQSLTNSTSGTTS
jgi:thiol-disulfide isomerase/thioredoxin